MLDIQTRISLLTRPRLMVRAARFGLDDYRRETHLRRALQSDDLPRPAEALVRLMEIETELEYERKTVQAAHSFARHVEILIAIMGEARLLRTAFQTNETTT